MVVVTAVQAPHVQARFGQKGCRQAIRIIKISLAVHQPAVIIASVTQLGGKAGLKKLLVDQQLRQYTVSGELFKRQLHAHRAQSRTKTVHPRAGHRNVRHVVPRAEWVIRMH